MRIMYDIICSTKQTHTIWTLLGQQLG